jgi:uncharacterized cupredoxin-like copper-binding protein
MKALRASVVVPAAALLLLAGAGCSDNNDPSGSTSSMPTTGDVNSVEKDFSIALGTSTASAGALNFAVHNEGPSVHEFVVFKTDLAEDALPTSDDGTVDEEGEGVRHINEIEDIAAGSNKSLDVNLDAGKYVLICNLPGHYAQGMHASLTIG